MNFLVVILLVVAVAALLMSCFWLFAPTSKESVNIHLDKDTKMNISKDTDGVHIALVGGGVGAGAMDADLFPQVEMEVAPPTPLTRDFWLKVARIEDLAADERGSLCKILLDHGIITPSERDYFLAPAEGGHEDVPDGGQPEAPAAPWENDPSIPSPADELPDVFEEEESVQAPIDDITEDEF